MNPAVSPVRIAFWMVAAFGFHMAQASTPFGTIRLELPFLIMVWSSIRDARFAGLAFFLPSLLFDSLDGTYASTLSHTLVFILIRRLRGIMDFVQVPALLLLGVAAAGLDRLVFGVLIQFQVASVFDLSFQYLLDPAYILTIVCLPIGLFWDRRTE